MALEFRPPVTAARLGDKDKCLEPMFGDVGQARTNAAMLLLMIATTSSRTCTKPTVVRIPFLLGRLKCGSGRGRRLCPVGWARQALGQVGFCAVDLCS